MSGPFQNTMKLPALGSPCRSCRKPIPADAQFCPACGTAIDGPADASAPSDPHLLSPDMAAEALVSEANLLRLRGEFAAAESRCIEVLRLDPNHLHAHSMLGDIFRDQDRLEDAAQWYQLALDLDPGSASDRAKLKETEEQLARGLVRSFHAAPSPAIPSGTQRLAGLPPTAWLNGLWAVFAIFIIAATILIVSRRGKSNAGTTTTAAMSPSAGTASASNRGMGPFVLPPQQAVKTSNARIPPAPPLDARVPPSGVALPADTQLQVAPLPGPGVPATTDYVISSFTVDASQAGGAMVISQRGAPSEEPESLRRRTAQNAFNAARSQFASSPSLQRLGITVRLGGGGAALFAGEIERSAVDRVVDMGDHSQILSAFPNHWWNPQVGPGTDVPASGGAGTPTESGDGTQ